jgi:hypothetical protein
MLPLLVETTPDLRKFRNSNQNNETELAGDPTSSNEFNATLKHSSRLSNIFVIICNILWQAQKINGLHFYRNVI